MQNLNISASFPYYDDGSSSQMQTYHFTTGHGNGKRFLGVLNFFEGFLT